MCSQLVVWPTFAKITDIPYADNVFYVLFLIFVLYFILALHGISQMLDEAKMLPILSGND
jgi:hypothetical protein